MPLRVSLVFGATESERPRAPASPVIWINGAAKAHQRLSNETWGRGAMRGRLRQNPNGRVVDVRTLAHLERRTPSISTVESRPWHARLFGPGHKQESCKTSVELSSKERAHPSPGVDTGTATPPHVRRRAWRHRRAARSLWERTPRQDGRSTDADMCRDTSPWREAYRRVPSTNPLRTG